MRILKKKEGYLALSAVFIYLLSTCPYPHHPPSFNEMIDGGVHLFLLDEVVSPGLLQLHHLDRESHTSQLDG